MLRRLEGVPGTETGRSSALAAAVLVPVTGAPPVGRLVSFFERPRPRSSDRRPRLPSAVCRLPSSSDAG
jgi:hypothetical protein